MWIILVDHGLEEATVLCAALKSSNVGITSNNDQRAVRREQRAC